MTKSTHYSGGVVTRLSCFHVAEANFRNLFQSMSTTRIPPENDAQEILNMRV